MAEQTISNISYGEREAAGALVMKGGGIKGLAYVGALEVLLEKYTFDRYVGTSAGAISALLLAAGYTIEELKTILREKDFRDFFDAKWWQVPANFTRHGGMYHADAFTCWMATLLAEKLESPTAVEMSDLPSRATVFASRVGKSVLRFDSTVPETDAANAARCSMSIPLVFVPQTDQGFLTYDGGLTANFPIVELQKEDPEAKFIGLYLGSAVYRPRKPRWQIQNLLTIWTEQNEPETLKEYRDRIVMIDPTPIGTLDFNLSQEEKQYLLLCGRIGALAFVEKNSERHLATINELKTLRIEVDQIRGARERRRKLRRLACGILTFVLPLVLCWGTITAVAGLYGVSGNSPKASQEVVDRAADGSSSVNTTIADLERQRENLERRKKLLTDEKDLPERRQLRGQLDALIKQIDGIRNNEGESHEALEK